MSKDLMIDIETLDVLPTSTILTIGAQGFDPFSDKFSEATYYKRLTLDSQESRTINEDTVAWWGQQGEAAQEEALGEGPDRVDIVEALGELSKLAWKHDRIWANGTTFDMVILENAMKQYGVTMPWKYWQVMDARTVYKLGNAPKLGNSHNALEDCVNQIDLLQKTLKQLGITKF